jgi:hypothetical protein
MAIRRRQRLGLIDELTEATVMTFANKSRAAAPRHRRAVARCTIHETHQRLGEFG